MARSLENEPTAPPKTIEISHGSDYSKISSRSTSPDEQRPPRKWILHVLIIILVLTLVILLPLFWYGDIGVVSNTLKRYDRYRRPVVITLSVLSFLVLCVVFRSVCKKRKRASDYESRIIAQYHDEGTEAKQDSLLAATEENLIAQATSQMVSFRQKLEELSTDTIKEILQVLASCCKDINFHENALMGDTYFAAHHQQQMDRRTLSHCHPEYLIQPHDGRLTTDSDSYSERSKSYTNQYVVCHNLRLKALLVGDTNVGKTSIFHRILYDQFSETYITTLGCDVGVSSVHFSDNERDKEINCSVHLWDIGGNGLKYDISRAMFRDTVLFLAVCDASSPNVTSIIEWLTAIRSHVYDPNIVILINKTDLSNVVLNMELLSKFPECSRLQMYEVSAKTGAGVTASFRNALACALWKEASNFVEPSSPEVIVCS